MKFAGISPYGSINFFCQSRLPQFSCLASDQTASAEEVMAFLNEAVAYVNDNGVEKALEEFNNFK